MIDLKDIPDTMLSLIRERFETDERVRKLRILQDLHLRKGRYEQSFAIAGQIESLFADVVRMYIESADQQQVQFDTETMEMSRDDKDRMLQLLLVVFISCDIIESSIIDLNDTLHRTNKDVDITTFDDLSAALKMAKEKLKYLSKNSNYMDDLTWADGCDNMYRLMQNKAKAIIRKERTQKATWGDNVKKLKTR